MLTDDEISAEFDKQLTTGNVNIHSFARAIIAAYQAKLRQGVELPEPAIYADNGVEGYTQDQLQQVDAAAEQRGYLRGLETALLKVTGLSVDVERCTQLQLTTQAWEEALDAAAYAIEQLKVKP